MTTSLSTRRRTPRATLPDPAALEIAARKAEGGEHYHLIARGRAFRLGVVAYVSAAGDACFRIELLLRIYRAEGQARSLALRKAARLITAVERMCYLTRHQDGGWISCEKRVTGARLAGECRSLLRAIGGLARE